MAMTTDTRVWTVRYDYDPKARAWSAVSDPPRVASWGRTLAQARACVREAIELHLDLPDSQSLDDIGVVVQDQVIVPGVEASEVASLQERRVRSELLRSEVARDTERLVSRLLEQGLSTRDAGTVVGVSGGRVSQYRKQTR
jgi:predicted RNase H-like HicB family nuclease